MYILLYTAVNSRYNKHYPYPADRAQPIRLSRAVDIILKVYRYNIYILGPNGRCRYIPRAEKMSDLLAGFC